MSKPFTVRLSDAVTKIIESVVIPDEKNPSDFIREAVEEKAYAQQQSFSNRVVPLLMEPKETVNLISEKLNAISEDWMAENISLQEKAAFIKFIHEAYLSSSGYVNPEYVFTLIDMTHELMQEAIKQGIALDFKFFENRLGFDLPGNKPVSADCYDAHFFDLLQRLIEMPSAGHVEGIIRPLSSMVFHLDQFSDASVSRIFSLGRMRKLLPVAVKGAKAGLSNSIISRDMKQLMPDPAQFKVGGVEYMITAEPIYFVATGGHHQYSFKAESLMSLITFSLNNPEFAQSDSGPGLIRATVEVEIHDEKVIIHEHGGYRLYISKTEFFEIMEHLKALTKDKRWNWLFSRYRNLRGDI